MASNDAKARSHRMILITAGVFLAPIVLATGLYFGGWRPAPTNYGALVTPAVPLPAVDLKPLSVRTPERLSGLYGKWLLVVVSDGACGRACTGSLYKTRATAGFQGDNSRRVRRLLLVSSNPGKASLARLAQTFPGLHVAILTHAARETLGHALSSHPPAPGAVYLIDPLGNWMMWYPANADARGMRKDLSHLLSVSQIG